MKEWSRKWEGGEESQKRIAKAARTVVANTPHGNKSTGGGAKRQREHSGDKEHRNRHRRPREVKGEACNREAFNGDSHESKGLNAPRSKIECPKGQNE